MVPPTPGSQRQALAANEIRGRVVSIMTGKPIRGTTIVASSGHLRVESLEFANVAGASAVSGLDGTFRLTLRGTGYQRLAVIAKGFHGAGNVVVDGGF